MLESFLTPEALNALWKVIMIDLVLAGDNAIVIGMAAAGLPADQRTRAVAIGIAAATVLRIIFALLTTQLLQIVGLLLVGGLLLLWVCWKMWRELRAGHAQTEGAEVASGEDINKDGSIALTVKPKTLREAATQIVIADVSMSLDNVLGVAGAAHAHPQVLVFGLVFSIALMGMAATFIARLLGKYRWIGWAGLLIILYVAAEMIWNGGREIQCVTGGQTMETCRALLTPHGSGH